MRLASILSAVLFLAAMGCSKSPEQFGGGPVSAKDGYNQKLLPEVTDVEQQENMEEIISKPIAGEGQIGSAKSDEFINANSLKPIKYAEGAAGITFKTTLKESKKLLSKPRNGPDADGVAVYDESVLISWRADKPRTPNFILLLSGYLGKVEVPAPHKSFRMGHDFSVDYSKDKAGAQLLGKDLFAIFSDKPKGYDCVAKGDCELGWGTAEQKNFTINMPGMLLLISKDRFRLFRILISKKEPLGILDNHLDLVTGQFSVKGEAPVQLGDTYKDFEKRQGVYIKELEDTLGKKIEIETDVNMLNYGRRYGGAWLGFNRTDYDRKAIKPKETDQLKAIQVWGKYKKLFTVDGNAVIISEYKDRVELNLEPVTGTSIKTMEDHRKIPLQVNLGLQPSNVKEFSEQLTDLLVASLKAKLPGATVFSRLSGQYQRKQVKEFLSIVVVYDEKSAEGKYVQFKVSEETGHISYFHMEKFGNGFDPLDSIIVPQAVVPLKAMPTTGNPFAGETFSQLSGFKIGDKVTVKDWDLGRREAMVTIGNHTSRGMYFDVDVQYVAFNSDQAIPRNVAYVKVGSLSSTMALKLLADDGKERIYKVIGITSSLLVSEVQNLCESSFSPKFGMSSLDFLTQLQAQGKCEYLLDYDDGGNGRLEAVYFPKQRLKLSFDDQELLSATVYAPKSEVK